MKKCSRCKNELDYSYFYSDRTTKDGFTYYCKCCSRENAKKWNSNNIEKKLLNNKKWSDNNILRWKYGSTEEYNEICERQNGKCLICDQVSDKKLHMDHCHETKKIRGLICNNCNIGLGFFRDNIDFLNSAIEYLKRYK